MLYGVGIRLVGDVDAEVFGCADLTALDDIPIGIARSTVGDEGNVHIGVSTGVRVRGRCRWATTAQDEWDCGKCRYPGESFFHREMLLYIL